MVITVTFISACATPTADQVVLEKAEEAAVSKKWESAYLQLEQWLTDCNGAIRSKAALIYHRYPEIQMAARESFSKPYLHQSKVAWGGAWEVHAAERLLNYSTVSSPAELQTAISNAGVKPSGENKCKN